MSLYVNSLCRQYKSMDGGVVIHEEPINGVNLQDFALACLEVISGAYGTQPYAFFQTSEEVSGEYRPLKTVIGYEVFESMTIVDGRLIVSVNGDQFELEGEPLSEISKRLAGYNSLCGREAIASKVGALGYFTYESVRFFEPALKNRLGSLQNTRDAELFVFRNYIVVDHKSRRMTLVSGFASDSAAAIEKLRSMRALTANVLKNFSTTSRMSLAARAVASQCVPISCSEMNSSLGKERLLKAVAKLKENISAGDIFQGVLSERFQIDCHASPYELFHTLLCTSSSPYSFLISNGTSQILGASPEMLVTLKNGSLEMHPIAGTRPRGANDSEEKKFEEQLRRSVKENAEHLMLVDLARNDLGRISEPGSVHVVSQGEIRKFSSVMHLVSRVKGTLKKGFTAIEALMACFPAGTLSGAPKIRAIQLLSELEGTPRGFYGGAITHFTLNGDLDSCIAIRCMRVDGSRVTIQAGAGIVADSQPEREYGEVVHKTRTLRHVLAIAAKMFRKEKAG